jgi:hypothetical protein
MFLLASLLILAIATLAPRCGAQGAGPALPVYWQYHFESHIHGSMLTGGESGEFWIVRPDATGAAAEALHVDPAGVEAVWRPVPSGADASYWCDETRSTRYYRQTRWLSADEPLERNAFMVPALLIDEGVCSITDATTDSLSASPCLRQRVIASRRNLTQPTIGSGDRLWWEYVLLMQPDGPLSLGGSLYTFPAVRDRTVIPYDTFWANVSPIGWLGPAWSVPGEAFRVSWLQTPALSLKDDRLGTWFWMGRAIDERPAMSMGSPPFVFYGATELLDRSAIYIVRVGDYCS